MVTFEGVVRNNTKGRPTLYLDYECYESMALKMLAQIGCEIAASHEVAHIAMVHRLGRMLIGEASVAVIVTVAAPPGRVRSRAGRNQSAEKGCPDLEEGALRGWRGLGGRRVGW